jgi:cell surface protein SprA
VPADLSAGRVLAVCATAALVLAAALVATTSAQTADRTLRPARLVAVSDTDSVQVDLPTDWTPADSLTAPDDSTRADSLRRQRLLERYLPRFRGDSRAAQISDRRRPLLPPIGSVLRRQTELDSTEYAYTIRERVGETDVRVPVRVGIDAYAEARFERAKATNFESLVQRRAQQQRTGIGPLVNITIPGGRQSAFTTIFGKNEVSIRVNGSADINAGFDYRRSDQLAASGQGSRLDPNFRQNLRLSIIGSIGDKLRVDVNWDTENQFEYQNQVRLAYTGYEDEIIQSIEAGNVFLQTPSTLIRGGQSLFGIKTKIQLGRLSITGVASQQEGQSDTRTITGGAEETTFDLRPTDYDENRHFFLGYYFRNWYETALAQPPNVIVGEVRNVERVEVWRLEQVGQLQLDTRNIVALVDLGESDQILRQTPGSLYQGVVAPGPSRDQYSDAELTTLRNETDNNAINTTLQAKGLAAKDFQTGIFRKLEPRDYDIDPALGYLSLTQPLRPGEALAISYRYQNAQGQYVQVGDLTSETGGSDGSLDDTRLIVKLLRPANPLAPTETTVPAPWYLEMRNIYPLRGGGLRQEDFELDIVYLPPSGQPSEVLPRGVGGTTRLLELLGLDRVRDDNSRGSDNRFDYLSGYTIDVQNGRIIFPFLEPFGGRILDVAAGNNRLPDARDNLAFADLYRTKRETAQRNAEFDVYRIQGSYQGASQSFFDLRAFNGLIEGSVRVTAGGQELREGIDYTVDYTGSGTVNIINTGLLGAGREIEIDYEQNNIFNIQQKTLLGARAEYALPNRLQLGATVFNLSQRSQVDKFRLGEEPISNTIWGVDGRYQIEPDWLTRAVDALPFIQTRAPSSIDVRGEFAQLLPGNQQTTAFRQTRRDLRNDDFGDLDFYPDELTGISTIDDFESFENTTSLRTPGIWRVASAPDSIGVVDAGGPPGTSTAAIEARTRWRSALAWYQIQANNELGNTEALRQVNIRDVFPTIDVNGLSAAEELQPTLDLFFDPRIRGPYNYNPDLASFFQQPEQTWGGMMTDVPDGFSDFELKNVEFVEFIFKPIAENGSIAPGAVLNVDLGLISEDVIPDGRLNTEDGLVFRPDDPITQTAINELARSPTKGADGSVDYNPESGRTEDLGLDGFVSFDVTRYPDAPEIYEVNHFAEWLAQIQAQTPVNQWHAAEIARSLFDPSADDYFHFTDSRFFGNATFFPNVLGQHRFLRLFPGQELNGQQTQSNLARSDRTDAAIGNSSYPDSEDLNRGSSIDLANNYFQYTIPLDEGTLDELGNPIRDDDFIVGEIQTEDGIGTGWYQVRIPVRDFTRRVGDIEDFRGVETIRMWMTGVDGPTTLRFATLELVGSQWEKSQAFATERGMPSDTAAVSISSVNSEENSGLYLTPSGVVVNRIISQGNSQPRIAREQSLVLTAENLQPGMQAGITKPYSDRPLNLLKHSNIRMFAHLNGRAGSQLMDEQDRGKVNLVVRFGSNDPSNYYEYEQPLTPTRVPVTSTGSAARAELWRNEVNALNIEIAALNQLKFERNQRAVPFDSVFTAEPGNTVGLPDPETFAPPGTRLSLRGNPSLDRITTITIGLRNPADSTSIDPADFVNRAEVWVNELRVAGPDERAGSSGLASVDIRLADFATVRASYQQQTDGFGALTSTLNDRDQNASTDYALSTDVQLDKLLPQSAGWSLPVSLSYVTGTVTPRFSPTRGDVALDAILEGIDQQEFNADGEPLTDSERERLKQLEREAAETLLTTRSASFRASKTGSKTTLLRHTVDAVTVSYATANRDARSPRNSVDDSWSWNGTVGYTLPNQDPRTVRPLWLLDRVPILGVLGGLRFNYVPTTFGVTAQAQRNFTTSQERPSLLVARVDTVPRRVTNPFREVHTFNHGRDFRLQYNPFSFLRTSFETGVSQVLSVVGVDTVYNRVSVGREGEDVFSPLTAGEAAALRADTSFTGFVEERVQAVPFGRTVSRVFSGDDRFRTDNYRQNFTGTLTLPIPRSINWASVTPLAYNARYTWTNGAAGQNLGATVSSNVSVATGLTLRPVDFFRTFDWFKGFEDEQKEAEREAEQRRQEAERARQQAKEQREAERAAERAAEEIAEAARRAAIEAAQEAADDTPAVEANDDPLESSSDLPPTRDMLEENVTGGDVEVAAVADTTDERRGLSLTLPSGRSILRRTVLALGGTRDFTVRYTGRFASASNGVVDQGDSLATAYSLIDALGGSGPPLGYRFGLERRIDPSGRFYGDVLVQDNLTDDHSFQASTALSLSSNLNINLAWDLSWNQNRRINLSLGDGSILDENEERTGGAGTQVWAFGSSYRDLFAAQQATLLGDLEGRAPGDTLRDFNGDGRVVLTNESVVSDFVSAYTAGPGTVGLNGLLPFPMPSWQVNYTGLSKLPLLNRFAQSASLRHGYSASYATSYVSNPVGAESAFRLGQQFAVAFDQPELEATSININERWSPLIGADVNWKGGLKTALAYNRSNLHSLVPSTYDVSERTTNELSATVGWQKQNLNLPILGRLNNRVTFQMAVAHSVNNELTRKLQPALIQAADLANEFRPEDALGGEFVGIDQTTTRLTITPTVGYQFSNTVQGTFSLKYEQFDSESSNVGSFSNLTGLFTVRVSISSN